MDEIPFCPEIVDKQLLPNHAGPIYQTQITCTAPVENNQGHAINTIASIQ